MTKTQKDSSRIIIQRIQDFREITDPVPVDHVAIIGVNKQDPGNIDCVGYALVWETKTKQHSFGVLTDIHYKSVYTQLYIIRTAIQSCQDSDNLNIITTDDAVCKYLTNEPLTNIVITGCKAIREEVKDMILKRTGTTQIIRKRGKRSILQKEAKFLAKIAYRNEIEKPLIQNDQISRIFSHDVGTTSSRSTTRGSSNPNQHSQIMDTLRNSNHKTNTTVDRNEFDTEEDYIPLDTTGTIQSLQDRKGKKRAPHSQEVEQVQYNDDHSLLQSILPLRRMIKDRIRSSEWKNERNPFLRLHKSIEYENEQKLIEDEEKIQSILSTSENNIQNQNKKRRTQNEANKYGGLEKRSQITNGSSSSSAPLLTEKTCQTNGISSNNGETDKESIGWIQSVTRWFKK